METEKDARRRAALARLRAELGRDAAIDAAAPEAGHSLEQTGAPAWSLGAAGPDTAIGGGLALAAVHEAVPADARENGAAAGFAAALAARRLIGCSGEERPVLWCARRHGLAEAGALSGRGLAGLGLDPAAVLLASGRREIDVLWALEETARSGAVALAVGAVESADLTATRRLSLAAREQAVPVLLLRSARGLLPSAARTRWRIRAAPSRPPRFARQAPGFPRWRIALEKGFAERAQDWVLEWDDEAHRFHMAAALADSAAEDGPGRAGGIGAFERAG